MALVENRSAEGDQVVALDREHLIHSWSVQSALKPIPVARGEGRYFWDYEGKRYRDDPRRILLKDHLEIAIVIGTPPKRIPSDWTGAAF